MSDNLPTRPDSDNNTPRITGKQLGVDVLEVLNLERGVLYTIWGLIARPRATVEDYLYGNRRKHANPLRLLVFSTAIAAFLTLWYIGKEAGVLNVNINGEDLTQLSESGVITEDAVKQDLAKGVEQKIGVKMMELMESYLNIFMLASVPIYALLCALFFRKKGYNLAEHFVIIAFMASIMNIVNILAFGVAIFWENALVLSTIIALIYTAYYFMTVYKSLHFWGLVKTGIVVFLSIVIMGATVGGGVYYVIKTNLEEFGIDQHVIEQKKHQLELEQAAPDSTNTFHQEIEVNSHDEENSEEGTP